MKEITGALHSPGWWFTVVITGLIIAVAGSYAKGGTDLLIRTLNDAVKTRRASQRAEDLRYVRALVAEQEARIAALVAAERLHLTGEIYFVAAVVISAVGAAVLEIVPVGTTGTHWVINFAILPLVLGGIGILTTRSGRKLRRSVELAAGLAERSREATDGT